jgi:hypothetical protein
MIGPLPTAPEFNRVLVAIDKFTKWIEVKPITCQFCWVYGEETYIF